MPSSCLRPLDRVNCLEPLRNPSRSTPDPIGLLRRFVLLFRDDDLVSAEVRNSCYELNDLMLCKGVALTVLYDESLDLRFLNSEGEHVGLKVKELRVKQFALSGLAVAVIVALEERGAKLFLDALEDGLFPEVY